MALKALELLTTKIFSWPTALRRKHLPPRTSMYIRSTLMHIPVLSSPSMAESVQLWIFDNVSLAAASSSHEQKVQNRQKRVCGSERGLTTPKWVCNFTFAGDVLWRVIEIAFGRVHPTDPQNRKEQCKWKCQQRRWLDDGTDKRRKVSSWMRVNWAGGKGLLRSVCQMLLSEKSLSVFLILPCLLVQSHFRIYFLSQRKCFAKNRQLKWIWTFFLVTSCSLFKSLISSGFMKTMTLDFLCLSAENTRKYSIFC